MIHETKNVASLKLEAAISRVWEILEATVLHVFPKVFRIWREGGGSGGKAG